VSELGIADLIGKERVPVGQLARKVNVDESRLHEFVIPSREVLKFTSLFWFLEHVMRMLANRQVFRETEYGSDGFVHKRMSSIPLSSHEKNLTDIGTNYHCLPHCDSRSNHHAYTGLTMVIVQPILHSRHSDPRTPTS